MRRDVQFSRISSTTAITKCSTVVRFNSTSRICTNWNRTYRIRDWSYQASAQQYLAETCWHGTQNIQQSSGLFHLACKTWLLEASSDLKLVFLNQNVSKSSVEPSRGCLVITLCELFRIGPRPEICCTLLTGLRQRQNPGSMVFRPWHKSMRTQ